ncbi:hypothetical protein HYPBUDRAFT_164180 [Hyphopichia burtonii NRRL Y-1933]|uniref:Transcription factor MBP1 n=1 Tax=Hyphopichia burtonii NRRL Y-1933 TaxID=984485 RepID=A0A1E4RQM0_9ASCO|nr:hypothetical protein HYPBUDRAFT_164180 [Hyphopichia burtonii NRRL Y-1933]ODV69557.1 hypothetical protein HYPBUDRAFT_164180 [Hyphopichia burtonii NRRL Y-1933]
MAALSMATTNGLQIYLATYSNVPVFEFVTSEGPIMRRKSDAWINATHILKIAKFPKAKRTRILERDVQTGIHEKVQGGYGKYQGTYVPLNLGMEIAKTFGVYEILKPIFDFIYIEGQSETPPPAPKHSHASASNVAKRQASNLGASDENKPVPAKRSKSTSATPAMSAASPPVNPSTKASTPSNKDEPMKKRGRPKRVALSKSVVRPSLKQNNTTPIGESGPSFGTFNNNSLTTSITGSRINEELPIPSLQRHDTEQDALQVMASNMNVKDEDLELADKSSEDEQDDLNQNIHSHHNASHVLNHQKLGQFTPRNSGYFKHEQDDDELMSVRELFGTPRDSFERIVHTNNNHNNNSSSLHNKNMVGLAANQHLQLLQANQQSSQFPINHASFPNRLQLPSINGTLINGTTGPNGSPIGIMHDPFGLLQYHHDQQNPEATYVNYFKSLLNYICEDGNNSNHSINQNNGLKVRMNSMDIPEKLAHPPQPLLKININQPIDTDGNTIFHWACSMGNITIIHFLISIFSKFINLEVKNSNGETPLMFLVKFNNSFNLKNFPNLLDLLVDSILIVDNSGKTILHHIALASSTDAKKEKVSKNTKKTKEIFSQYYMECIFNKLIEFQDFKIDDNKKVDEEERKNLIIKFINHQDSDGNTAFHIISYYLNKRCIGIFLQYIEYIDLSIRNMVNFTVEDYMASHNHLLRADPNEINDEINKKPIVMISNELDNDQRDSINTQSFDSQLYYSKLAINLHSSTANQITEKLTELSYSVDKELKEKDDLILKNIKYLNLISQEKLKSQKSILKLFDMDHLLEFTNMNGKMTPQTDEDIESPIKNNDENTIVQEDNTTTGMSFIATQKDDDDDETITKPISQPLSQPISQPINTNDELFINDDNLRDSLVQEEIERLSNDLSFLYLSKREEFLDKINQYQKYNEIKLRNKLNDLIKQYDQPNEQQKDVEERIKYSINLQQEILRKKQLVDQTTKHHIEIPISYTNQLDSSEEFKENRLDEDEDSIIDKLSPNDKLFKYCKLISICCNMNFKDVGNSINLIEQSLAKSFNGQRGA